MGHLYLLLGRAGLASLIILSGATHWIHYAAAGQSLEASGLPATLLSALIVLEVGGGLAILAGVFTRWSAGLLALLSLATGAWLYGDFNDQNQFIQLSKHAAMAGGYLMLVATGPGAFSVDAWRRSPAPPRVDDDCVVCG